MNNATAPQASSLRDRSHRGGWMRRRLPLAAIALLGAGGSLLACDMSIGISSAAERICPCSGPTCVSTFITACCSNEHTTIREGPLVVNKTATGWDVSYTVEYLCDDELHAETQTKSFTADPMACGNDCSGGCPGGKGEAKAKCIEMRFDLGLGPSVIVPSRNSRLFAIQFLLASNRSVVRGRTGNSEYLLVPPFTPPDPVAAVDVRQPMQERLSEAIGILAAATYGLQESTRRVGALWFHAEDLTNGVADPRSLRLDIELRDDVDVAWAQNEYVRQVLSPTCLLDVVTNLAGNGYSVSYYGHSDVLPEFDDDGYYQLATGAVPFASYVVTETIPAQEVRFVSISGSVSNEQVFARIGPRSVRLTEGDGQATRVREVQWAGNTNRESLIRLEGASPETLRLVASEDWEIDPRRMIRKSFQEAGVMHSTTFGYDGEGRLALERRSDGSWTGYAYDELGRTAEERTAWLDAPMTGAVARCTTFGYPEDSFAFSPAFSEAATSAGGIALSRSTRTVTPNMADSGGWRKTVETFASADPSVPAQTNETWIASYGWDSLYEPGITNYAIHCGHVCDGRVGVRIRADGSRDTLVYDHGVLDTSGAPSDWHFTALATGACVRVTTRHGTATSPNGIPGRTTWDVAYESPSGDTVFEERLLYLSDSFQPRASWAATFRDGQGRVTSRRRSDGTLAETEWSCCGPSFETAADGTVAETVYDALRRPIQNTSLGEGARPDIFTETAYDAAGRAVSRRTYAGSLSQTTTNAYDAAGRLAWSRGPDGVESLYAYGSNSTTTVRGGLTNLSVRFADGRAHYTEQNGVRRQTHAYGVNPDGTQWTLSARGPLPAGLGSTLELPNFSTLELLDFPWEIGIADPLGRTVAQIRPGYSGALLVTSNAYDTANRLVRTSTLSASAPLRETIFTYDDLGEPLLTCEDLDLDGEIDLGGPDRVSG